MKNFYRLTLAIILVFYSCQTDVLDENNPSTNSSEESNVESIELKIPDGTVYNVVDADRCPYSDIQPTANLWWPENEDDYFDPNTYFSSTDDNKLTFSEYDDGTARLTGSTLRGTCVVEVDVWFKDRTSWEDWEATGGEFKKEGCAGDVADEEEMHFYMIDAERSTLTATGGDCLGEGAYTLEQRPDPLDLGTPNFGAHVGPGGANYDSNEGAYGMSTWAWILNSEGERMWIMDFNFRLNNAVCTVVDADRCPFGDIQPTANLWWPENEDEYFDPNTYFSSTEDNKLTFAEYNNGTAHLTGSTLRGSCVVEVDIWFKDRTSWEDWEAAGGEFKREGCAGDAAMETEMHFYVIDADRSTFTSTGGDCLGEGTYTLEQRPDPLDLGTPNFGAHVGPGGANYDSNEGAYGMSTWAWIINSEGERMWIMDFNFLIDCSLCDIE